MSVPFSSDGDRLFQAVITASGSGTLYESLAAFRPDLTRRELVACVNRLALWLVATRERLDETAKPFDLRNHDEVRWVGPALEYYMHDMLTDRSALMGERLLKTVLNEFFGA